MSEKQKQIIEAYEEMLLNNIEKCKNGESLDTVSIYALNDGIRILHHIQQIEKQNQQ